MGNRLTEAKKTLIRKRVLQGVPNKEIAREVQCDVRTIRRIKKEMPAPVNFPKEEESADKSYFPVYDYSTSLTKKEEALCTKILKEVWLYEDIEEGWTYHLTKHNETLRQSGLWWVMIVYPDSAPFNWVQVLRARGYRIAISPLHDKDTWNHDSPECVNVETGEIIPKGARYKAGDPKKAHWHVIVCTDTKTSYREINEELQRICHCPYIQKCRSLKNAYEYFLHINNPEKYQGYDKDEIQTYNNFHIEPNKFEIGIMTDEILTVILEKQITDMLDLIAYYLGQIEYEQIMWNKPGLFTAACNGMWRRLNPEGKTQLVKIVTDDDKKGRKSNGRH